jgi:hypothetical protein
LQIFSNSREKSSELRRIEINIAGSANGVGQNAPLIPSSFWVDDYDFASCITEKRWDLLPPLATEFAYLSVTRPSFPLPLLSEGRPPPL